MPIAIAAAGTYTERTAESSTAVPYPATVAAGDIAVLVGSVNNSATLTTNPSGWTQQASTFAVASAAPALPNLYVGTRVCSGSEGGTTVSVTHANNISAWQILTFSGVDTTTPLDIAAAIVTPDGGASTVTIPSQTIITAGAALVYAATVSGSSSTATPPSGFTESGDRGSGTRPLTTGYKLGASAGASGAVAVTFSGSGNLIGVLLALRPAATDTGVRIWTGAAWAPAGIKRWSGSAWT